MATGFQFHKLLKRRHKSVAIITLSQAQREKQKGRMEGATILPAIHFSSTLWKTNRARSSSLSTQDSRQTGRQAGFIKLSFKTENPSVVFPSPRLFALSQHNAKLFKLFCHITNTNIKVGKAAGSSWLGHWLIDDVSDTINVIVIPLILIEATSSLASSSLSWWSSSLLVPVSLPPALGCCQLTYENDFRFDCAAKLSAARCSLRSSLSLSLYSRHIYRLTVKRLTACLTADCQPVSVSD